MRLSCTQKKGNKEEQFLSSELNLLGNNFTEIQLQTYEEQVQRMQSNFQKSIFDASKKEEQLSMKRIQEKERNLIKVSGFDKVNMNEVIHLISQEIQKFRNDNQDATMSKIKKLNQLSQTKKQKLINLVTQGKNKEALVVLEQVNVCNNGNYEIILGGGACCSSEMHLEGVKQQLEIIQTNQKKETKLEKAFTNSYLKQVSNPQHKNKILSNNEQAEEVIEIISKCFNLFKQQIPIHNDAYRIYFVEIIDLILQYMISGGFEIDVSVENDIRSKISPFLTHLKDNIKLHQCQDFEFMIQFLFDLNEQSFFNDKAKRKDLESSVKFVKLMIKNEINIQTHQATQQSYILTLEESKGLITNIQQQAFGEQGIEYIWQLVDKAHEKIRSLTKDLMYKQLVALWSMRVEYLAKIENIQIEDDIFFYISKFIEFTKQKSSSYLILYIMIQINFLLEKLGINNNNQHAHSNTFSSKLSIVDKQVREFIQILQQQSATQSSSENFFSFFSFTVKDITFRFLSNQILLKFLTLFGQEETSDKNQFWIHLVYSYVTEKNESVKVFFQDNYRFVNTINQKIKESPQQVAKNVIEYSKQRKQQFIQNKISEQEIEEQEDSIKDESDFLEKLSIKLIEKWELEARQRLDKDIPLKDDILLEVQDLYIDQNLQYLSANQIFSNNQHSFEGQNINENQKSNKQKNDQNQYLRISYCPIASKNHKKR